VIHTRHHTLEQAAELLPRVVELRDAMEEPRERDGQEVYLCRHEGEDGGFGGRTPLGDG
jgi:hypothetical protein